MAITLCPATGNTGAATSFTPSYTAPAAGDVEVLFLFRSSSTTVPTVPAGWSPWPSSAANTEAGVIAYRFCPTATPAATGTMTNATQSIIARYHGVHGIGNLVTAVQASSNSIAYNGPSGGAVQTAGNSWYVAFAGHRTASNVNTAPSGMTNRYSVGTGPQAALHDTNGGVTGWTNASVTVNASSGHVSFVLELLADGGAFSAINASSTGAWSLSTENKVAVSQQNPANTNCIRFITSHSTGKWIWGLRLFSFGSTSDSVVGLCTAGASMTVWPGGANNNGVGYGFNVGGNDAWVNHTATNNGPNLGTTWAVNDFGNIAVDLDAGLIWIQTDTMGGNWNGDPTASPDAGTGGFAYTDLIGQELFPFYGTGNNTASFAMNTYDFTRIDTDASTFTNWQLDPPTTVSGAGTAVGIAVVSGVGAKRVASAGSAVGIAVASGVGKTLRKTAGTAVGIAIASGVGSTGAAAGVGTAVGVAVVSGAGRAIRNGAGTAIGIAVASAVGRTVRAGAGSAVGIAVASAVGKTLRRCAGSAVGIAVASGVGKTLRRAAGTATGIAIATGAGASRKASAGTAVGVAVASGMGKGLKFGAGSAVGVAIVSAVGRSTARGAGTAIGVAVAQASSTGSNPGAGTAVGIAVVHGGGAAIAKASGAAVGVAVASAGGKILRVGAGHAVGVAIASGTAKVTASGAGHAVGVAIVQGESGTPMRGAGTAIGIAIVSGVGVAKITVGGAGTAIGVAIALGVSDQDLIPDPRNLLSGGEVIRVLEGGN